MFLAVQPDMNCDTAAIGQHQSTLVVVAFRTHLHGLKHRYATGVQ
ncbi:hypothetical protein [Microvirga sp.]|nr:hypothetical protein [Microvirga sp.]